MPLDIDAIIDRTEWTRDEGYAYYEFLRCIALAHGGEPTVVEFGTRWGLSTRAWSEHARRVITFDYKPCREIAEENVIVYKGDCEEQYKAWDCPFADIVYLDADHSYEGLMRHIDLVMPHSTIILVHDTVADPRSAAAVSRYERDHRCVTFPLLKGFTLIESRHTYGSYL